MKDALLYNVSTTKSTNTPNYTVPTLHSVSNVLLTINLPLAQKPRMNYQLTLSAVANI